MQKNNESYISNGKQALVQVLRDELAYRKLGNESYSLRAFARDLAISPSRLSDLLNGKGLPSHGRVKIMLKKIHFTDLQIAAFCKSFSTDRAEGPSKSYLLSQDEFKLVADWQHFALLTAMRLDDFDGTANWLVKRLGITAKLTLDSIERLQRVGLIGVNNGKFIVLKDDIETTDGLPSIALRNSHTAVLKKAMDSLTRDPMELRNISSITMAIDRNKIQQANHLIKKFRKELCKLLESDKKNAVYNLNIQLHPLTKEE